MASRSKAYTYLLSATFIWAFATVVIKTTLEGIDPLSFLTYRFFLSSLIAIPFLKSIIYDIRKNKNHIVEILIYSLLSTSISLGLLFFGLDQTTVLNLVLITLAAPIVTEYAGVYFFKEEITKREKIGTAIALLGTLLTVIEPLIENGADFGKTSGNILILAYLTADVISVICLKKLLKNGVQSEPLTHFSFIIGFITILPIALYFSKGSVFSTIAVLPVKYHLGVIYMAIFSGTIAYILRAKGQKIIEVSEAALFTYLNNTFSVPLAVLILKESVSIQFLIGAVIIAAGVFIAESKHLKRES